MTVNTLSCTAASPQQYRWDRDMCVPRLFEQQARRTPLNEAVVSEGGSLTYEQLSAQSDQLAHYLVRRGIGHDDVVGVFLKRSPELIVSLLAIHKAGAAFTAFETASPPERLSFVISDSGARLILTSRDAADSIPASTPVERISMEDLASQLESGQRGPLSVDIHPEGLACVLYTSGSTGKPKGVLIDHASVAQHATYVRDCYSIEPHDKAVLFSSPNFDAVLEQVFSTIISGATLVLRPEELWPALEFHRKVVELGITIINPPVAYWRAVGRELARTPGTLTPHTLKVVVIGGDAMLPEDVKTWSRTPFVTRKLIHCYGPTETTVYVANTEVPIPIEGTKWEHGIPIGWPVSERRIYLFDEFGTLAPDGHSGEIHIGGKGVALGYRNQPGQTALSFLPDPFNPEPGARMYRTGDLGCRRADGSIEFLGRIDHQVKIRGNRVEPREVEVALREFPGIAEVVVIGRGDAGEKRLVAYLVCNEGPPTVRSLQRFLGGKLPAHMVPAQYVFLDALPTLPSGKFDLGALPEPAPVELPAAPSTGATQAEEVLIGICKDVLGIDHVGRFDNFLELGGDSILGLQVIARATEAGYKLTYQDLFRTQTIAELAEAAGIAARTDPEPCVTGDAPPTPAQCLFSELNLARPNHFNQALMLAPLRPLDPDLCRKAFGYLLRHHYALRLRFNIEDELLTQRYDPPGEDIPFEHIDLASLPESSRLQRLEAHAAETQRSLNLACGPICRFVLYSMGRSQRLLSIVHHLAVDAVSWRILIEDFCRAYEQLRRSEPVYLGHKTASFQEWARKLHAEAAEPTLEGEVAYWEQNVLGEDAAVPVEADGENTVGSKHIIAVELDEMDTAALLSTPRQLGASVPDVMICALGRGLEMSLGASRALIDIESHGRDAFSSGDVDPSRTVGWFTVVYPFAVEGWQGEPSEALQAVVRRLRAVPRGGTGYGLLRYICPNGAIAGRMKRLPRARISFNYIGQWDVTRSEVPLMKFASEAIGPCIDESERRRYVLDVGASVSRRRLRVQWTFSRNQYRDTTIRELAECHVQSIRMLISGTEA